MNFNKDLKKVMILYPEAEVQSSSDYRDLVNIHNIVEATFGEKLDPKLVMTAFNEKDSSALKTANDYYYLIFKSAMENSEIKKFAYPMMFGPQDVSSEFDIDKWGGLVHKIYDAVSSGDMNLPSAIDYYAGTLDEKTSEDENFKKWIKYYQDGEHLKYSSDDDNDLKKEGFQFPLSGPGTYGPDNATLSREHDEFRKLKQERTQKTDHKTEYLDWRSKLYSAIRRIDKLLRQSDEFIDQSTHRDLADLLHHFDQEVRSLQHEVTAADLSFKYANMFKTAGFSGGHDELMKYSQEVMPDQLSPELENREDVPEPMVDVPAAEAAPPAEEPATEERGIDESALSRAFSGGEAGSGESIISGDITLNDAVLKLEEVAGRLSDRRTIRMLAEFDIMLDKIGVASMFPELAEAQSKLIDGYSYALTRVTRMLGMLASGKSLVEISDAKTKDLAGKTMKEVNKTLEPEPESERGTPAIQKGLEEAATPAVEPEVPAAEQAIEPTI